MARQVTMTLGGRSRVLVLDFNFFRYMRDVGGFDTKKLDLRAIMADYANFPAVMGGLMATDEWNHRKRFPDLNEVGAMLDPGTIEELIATVVALTTDNTPPEEGAPAE